MTSNASDISFDLAHVWRMAILLTADKTSVTALSNNR